MTNVSYPYPVLGNQDDFPESEFTVLSVSNPVVTEEDTTFRFDLSLSNESLNDLIAGRKAKIITEVSCRETYHKTTLTNYSLESDVTLPTSMIHGDITVRAWIVADSELHNYKPVGIHEHYGDNIFYVEKGDILAEGPEFWFRVDDEPAHSNKPNSSFIVIGCGADGTGPADIDYDQSGRIIISLRSEDYLKFASVSRDPEARKILHASLILPVLTQALLAFCDPETFEQYHNPNLEQYLRINKITDFENPLSLAQEILQFPITRTLEGAYALLIHPEENEDD